MMKKLFFGVLGLLALASCSDDEVTNVNRDGDEITFSVVTNSVSRAADVYCNNNLPEQFYLSATHDSKKYIDADNVEYDSKWENKSGTRYWPATGAVTFFAYHNAEPSDFTWNTTQPTVNFTVDGTVTAQKDFIYAKKTQSKPSDGTGQVTLNFRHALSQIVFMAKNTNPNLYVEIYGVSVCNVNGGKATFTYPTDDTSSNMKDENHDGDFNYNESYNVGSWNLAGATTGVDYTATLDTKVPLKGNKTAEAVSLTNNITPAEFNTKAMLLFPQTTTAWVPAADGKKPGDNLQPGTYFLVKCKIYNVANGDVNNDGTGDVNYKEDGTIDEVCLWGAGAENGENVAIPVAFDWKQGKKYIYTFVFGDGNGGYDPNKPNEPILVPITFNVTVDDFVSAGNTDKNMQTN